MSATAATNIRHDKLRFESFYNNFQMSLKVIADDTIRLLIHHSIELEWAKSKPHVFHSHGTNSNKYVRKQNNGLTGILRYS